MKRCPTCRRFYADGTFQFCLDDGAELVAVVHEQPTERFVLPTPVAVVEKKPRKFNWLAFSLFGGFGLLTLLGLLTAGILLLMRGGAPPVQTNTSGNKSEPAASSSLFGSSDETEIIVLMEKVATAFVASDTATLDNCLADEYIEENSNGEKFTKKDILEPQVVGERVALRYSDMRVATDKDTATVNGLGESKMRFLGTLVTQKFEFKARLVKRDGRWRGVYSYSKYLD